MHQASRARAFIDAGRFDLAAATIEQMPDDAVEKMQLQAIIAAQCQASPSSGSEQISELGKKVGDRYTWRQDQSQAFTARRSSAAGDYVLACNYAKFIINTELRQVVETEISQAKEQNTATTQ